ncbi:hypothetical protein [Rhodocyclus tenuis]|uniref:Uncharacterized protein n=1 Tax=Rhodocyclus tenuis TaxID=1066 RepID=A0A840G4Z8_RHOTE|nr:hypothetical protein [Rhodocyclus tenuis]MBB4247006.1 hypothetical protein [Rhodocyclus tenuis]
MAAGNKRQKTKRPTIGASLKRLTSASLAPPDNLKIANATDGMMKTIRRKTKIEGA